MSKVFNLLFMMRTALFGVITQRVLSA